MEAVNSRNPGWRKEIVLAVADAGVCWLCFSFLTDFFFSVYAQRIQERYYFREVFGALALLCLCIVTISQHTVLNRRPAGNGLMTQVLLRIPANALMFLLMLLNRRTVHIRIFPMGDFDIYYGVGYIYALGFYLVASVLLRLGIFLIHLMGAGKQPGHLDPDT